MASKYEIGDLVGGDGRTAPLDIPPNTHLELPQTSENTGMSSTPLEMSDLQPHQGTSEDVATPREAMAADTITEGSNIPKKTTRSIDEHREPAKAAELSAPTVPSSEPQDSYPSQRPTREPFKRQETAPAIGPASDKPMNIEKEPETAGPSIIITLLLTSGARHPYKIDGKYLKKRNVSVTGNDPVNMSVYTLKELIYREWREDGKFENGPTPHVVHMSIKPQEMVDEEDARMAKGGARLDRNGNERSPGCRCIIQ